MVVHVVAEEGELEVAEERETPRGGALAELRRRVAVEHALQAQRLELVPIAHDIRERP